MRIQKLSIRKPPIIGRLHLTYPLIILLSHGDCLGWFYSNFIQLSCQKKFNHESLNLSFYLPDALDWRFNYIWLEKKVVNLKILKRSSWKLNELIMDHIDEGYYTKIELNDFYVPNKGEYQKKNHTHLNFIYGYDSHDEIFYTIGFDEKSSFVESEIPFHQLEEAYNKNHSYEHTHFGDILFFKKSTRVSYDLDIVNIKEQLNDYIYSYNTSNRYRLIHNPETDQVFGMDVYVKILQYIELLKDGKMHYDIRNFHVLWEHKKCMVLRIKFLLEEKKYPISSLYDDFINIERKTLYTRNLMIKYRISGEMKILNRVKLNIEEIQESEKRSLLQLLTILD